MLNSDVNEREFKFFIDATQSGSLVDFHKYYKKEYLEKESDDDGWRPLHYASVYGQFKIAVKLIEEGCDIHSTTAIDWRPIHYAARYGQAEIVQLLVDKGCDYEACDRLTESRPIHHACKNGCTSVARILIENGCNIECCDAKNWRPIHYACINNYVEITHLLIENFCNIDARTPSGQSPIDMAKQKRNQLLVDIINAEIKNPKLSSDRKFLMACQQGNFSLAEFMITRKCNIEICDNEGKRSIHWACLNGHTEIVRLLVKNQCDIDACDNLNQCPIVFAKKNGNQTIIEILNSEISYRKSINQIFESIGVNGESICNQYFPSLQSQLFDKNDLIGSGGFGRVYQYMVPNTALTCAIKAIPNDILNIQIVKEHINKYLRNLNHSSIVQIYGAVEKPKDLLIFMEFLNGGSLNDKLLKEKSITLTDVIHYSFQCLKGLEFLHEIKHIIHRDIKPSNILLDSENNAKLADFDLSRLLLRTNGQTTSTRSIIGTAYFMAPEIFREENYSFSADIWSFGVTFFKMITGKFPFDEAEFPQIVINRITNTRRFEVPTLDFKNNDLKIIVESMLNPEKSMRPKASDLLKHEIFVHISSK